MSAWLKSTGRGDRGPVTFLLRSHLPGWTSGPGVTNSSWFAQERLTLQTDSDVSRASPPRWASRDRWPRSPGPWGPGCRQKCADTLWVLPFAWNRKSAWTVLPEYYSASKRRESLTPATELQGGCDGRTCGVFLPQYKTQGKSRYISFTNTIAPLGCPHAAVAMTGPPAPGEGLGDRALNCAPSACVSCRPEPLCPLDTRDGAVALWGPVPNHDTSWETGQVPSWGCFLAML